MEFPEAPKSFQKLPEAPGAPSSSPGAPQELPEAPKSSQKLQKAQTATKNAEPPILKPQGQPLARWRGLRQQLDKWDIAVFSRDHSRQLWAQLCSACNNHTCCFDRSGQIKTEPMFPPKTLPPQSRIWPSLLFFSEGLLLSRTQARPPSRTDPP